MRILIATHGYPPTHSAGAERRAERTARWLAAHGHEVRVLCVESQTPGAPKLTWEDRLQDGLPVRRLSLHTPAGRGSFRWNYDNPVTGSAAADLFRAWAPSVLHLFSGYRMSASVVRAAAQAGVPVVISLTDYWWFCHLVNLPGRDGARCVEPTVAGCARCEAEWHFRRYRVPAQVVPSIANWFWQVAGSYPPLGNRVGLPEQGERHRFLLDTLRSAGALVAPSRFLADFYVRHGVDPRRVHVSRQGVQPEGALSDRLPSPTLRVGYLGQMKSHKGVDLLLQAWSQLRGDRPRELRLYGSDAGESDYVHGRRLREAIARTDGVQWFGEIGRREVWQALSGLDVVVVPSRWLENSPNTILEAQALGIPVIGTNLGGMAELVQHERNGLLFELDNASDLTRQIQRLLDEPDLLPRLKAAPRYTRTVDEEMRQLCGLYEAVAGS